MDATSYLLGKKAGGGGITPSGTISITENGETNVTNYATANVNVQPDLETKSVTITENTTTTITPTSGKDGLSSVAITTNVSGSCDYNSKLLTPTGYAGEGIANLINEIGADFQIVGNSTQNMFKNCKKLTKVDLIDTSNVINSASMFENCFLLNNIALLDLSNVTTSGAMFGFCQALKTIPQFNTSKMTGGYRMFYYCSALENVPVLDTSSMINGMSGMFQNCSSLTNASLKNILQMCLNCPVTASSSKTLAFVGLSQTQAELCATFDEWQDLEDAGWTTGY